MKSVLVVYGTTKGPTCTIANFIADGLRARGVSVEVVDSATEAAAQVQPIHAAAIVCGSLHQHRFETSLLRFVKDNKGWLAGIPAAFVAAGWPAVSRDPQSREELRQVTDAFYRDTGWVPGITRPVAGALRYSRHGNLRRLITKLTARQPGCDIDTSHGHDCTDWDDLTRFVEEFVAAIPLQEPGHQND